MKRGRGMGRVVGLFVLVTTQIVMSARTFAQAPPPLNFPASAAVAGMGSTGAAAWNRIGAVRLNPALVSTLSPAAFEVSLFNTDRIDYRGFSVMGAIILPGKFHIGLSFRHKGIDDLIEDPAVDESGLNVGDAALGLAFGRMFLDDRLAVGAELTGIRSVVLETRGWGGYLNIGVAARVHPNVILGTAIRRVGPPIQWTVPTGADFMTDMEPALRAGAAISDIKFGAMRFRVAMDVEIDQNPGDPAMGVGAAVQLANIVAFRTGFFVPRRGDGIWSTGLGISVRQFGFDLTYQELPVFGSRFHAALRWSRESR